MRAAAASSPSPTDRDALLAAASNGRGSVDESEMSRMGTEYQRVQSDDIAPRVQRLASSPLDFITGRLETDFKEGCVSLEHDCYSIAVLDNTPAWAAVALPMLSATGQILLLYFMAFANDENMFDEGHWLEPKSSHGNVKIMKVIGILIALFKVSTEVHHAQALFRALTIGEIRGHARRLCGWWSLMMQYVMAILVLFVVTSVVLAGQSCTFIMSKIFSTFVIVDMDNLMARFLEVVWRLHFHIKVDTELCATWRTRERLVGGMSVRLCFLVLPATFILCEVGFSLLYNTPPHTVLMHGYVSNHMPPMMLTPLVDGCCPPLRIALSAKAGEQTEALGTSVYNYSVMFLAPLGSPPPVVRWIALEAGSEPHAASSLQVWEGRDGDGNWALNMGGARSHRVQAGAYLQDHGYARQTYLAVQQRKALYQTMLPFEAIFSVTGLKTYGSAYRIYAVAQNPETQALAKSPVASATLVTSVCAQRCLSCEMSGSGRCDRCVQGTHRTSQGLCMPCPENCLLCEESAAIYGFSTAIGSFEGRFLAQMPCDVGGCNEGYGLTSDGVCKRCSIANCLSCDGDTSTCRQCRRGHGIGANGTCLPCAHERCICIEAGQCDLCETGWGFTSNGTCAACQEGCAMCEFAHDGICESCRSGFGFDDDGRHCKQCLPHCMSCNVSGPAGCDFCQSGFGFDVSQKRCSRCTPEHCLECDGSVPYKCTRCEYGFGVTHEGQCDTCGADCKRCDAVGRCKLCHSSFTVSDGVCKMCGDRCQNCSVSGPARCDNCWPGYVIEPNSRTCMPHGAVF
eukprot:TRINITY_DN11121_c1_g4_i1.p1 TRINITY_DN11121_c1_g4~~TRINITY_DN11121_c1_g4_i1.p1  ORF type:complete len:816 (-),score=141.68 TRINITY_DN11121_c1_g4_i1:149-2536(-)